MKPVRTRFKLLSENLGFSLSELLVMMFITSVIMSSVATLAVWGGNEFRRLQAEIQAQRDVMRLETLLRKYMSQALQVEATPIAQGGDVRTDEMGRFLGPANGTAQNLNTIALMTAARAGSDFITIGSFLREWGNSRRTQAANTTFSRVLGTGIYYLPPIPRAGALPGKAGMIFIDDGGAVAGPPSRRTSPDLGDLWFLGITEISVQKQIAERATGLVDNVGTNPDVSAPGSLPGGPFTMLKGYTINFTMRIQLQNNADVSYCPDQDILNGTAGCDAGAAYIDMQREVKVSFANNNLGMPMTGVGRNPANNAAVNWAMERPMGNLHFFRPIFPDVWEN
ncbi:MAG: hypothetical protein HRT45_00465 [Bdellovibrionales bacterium]|nr:hypothetical protein [Bdellovibrionales bacterium]